MFILKPLGTIFRASAFHVGSPSANNISTRVHGARLETRGSDEAPARVVLKLAGYLGIRQF